MPKVKVNLPDLIDAFENCRVGYQYYLDLKTGEVFHISDEWMDEDEIEKICEKMEMESERYLSIPPDASQEGYRDMVAFIEGIKEEALKEKLEIALDGKGAFRRFKDVLLGYPQKREEWFKFKEERTKKRIERWLEENGIEIEE